jgi:M6 family metalloprotease-like protein
MTLVLSACGPKASVIIKNQFKINEKIQQNLALKIAKLPVEDKSDKVFIEEESGRAMGPMARHSLIQKSREKRENASIFETNERIIKANAGHTKIYPFRGKYRIIVIPVQFSDVKFEDKAFFKANSDGVSLAQDYIFGKNKNSMASYYKHSSMGNLNLEGEVTPIITVDKSLHNYGEAVTGKSDRYANGLVIDALKKLKKIKTNQAWWFKYDTWDLSDYDKDNNFHEPDGFLDAVVLIYAGKSQASCQRSFDTNGTRPASVDVPAGPRQAAAQECFNRLWPHRWSINMSENDSDFSTKGPVVEGRQRPAMNGLKINDNLFAVDYNMQSEFSDRSTFIHEFGHSLSLPDIYSGGKANSTGSWEIMSSNARLQAQEFSSYSKITLGWLSPKIVEQGEATSAYLGAYNFVSKTQRENIDSFQGPNLNRNDESVVSTVPDSGEGVYRSIMVITDPSTETRDVVETTGQMGSVSAYSSRYDGESRALSFTVDVPLTGDAKVSFDTIYHIETETNFNSKEEEIKIVTDFDIGQILINDKIIEKLRIVSGDTNYNTLNESNPQCDEVSVLQSRKKLIAGKLTKEEEVLYKKAVSLCQAPVWINKAIDLSKYRGQTVDFRINYVTDAGYTEFGIVIDNVKLPGLDIIDFEDSNKLGEFKALINGSETLSFSQYYLMEHRLPKTEFISDGNEASYNMDNNINVGGQSFFTKEGQNQLTRFRMVTFDYQPGVLVWYFNSKYGRNSSTNTPVKNSGKGYLLVLNSRVGEVQLPGVFSSENLFDENGTYLKVDLEDDTTSSELEVLVKSQRDQFICFSHTNYSTYLTGVAPICDLEFKDELKKLTFKGKELIYERERSNEVLPDRRYSKYGAGTPYSTGATVRTGLSTFRPVDSNDFSPFKVFKAQNGAMVLDELMTSSTVKIKPVSLFNDSENKLHNNPRFQGDTVVVEKTGFNFEVVSPSPQVLGRYIDDINPDSNDSSLRAPKTKIYFSWK